ncbi:hypothetical protein BJ944DRAFT_238252 [Cunninghamella echinulata]|nr:hypothetical protein BJ944DRAFT_238252 [Cunninghamella echinulata]
MTTTYWYSTNGMDHKRLADRHVSALDEAFERQTRVQIVDPEAFGNHPAIASPHLGTMTSGEIHYGLYRQPSLWESSDNSLDNLLFIPNITNDNNTTAVDTFEMVASSPSNSNRQHHHTTSSSSSSSLQELLNIASHKKCSHIDRRADQCKYVQQACSGFSGMYLEFYYCSQLWKPLSVTIMISGLLFLFGAVSVVASDFFCPNLQTISTKLQLSESMAGVTILAFGNGSPDLFSTFSAMNTGSGSLAIGELIGAAFFIVSVVSGSMGIIRPFKSKRITFMRDASFLTGAIIMITWIVYHQRICWYHGVGLILYYVSYVVIVVFGAYQSPIEDDDDDVTLDEETHPILATTPVNQLESKSVNQSIYDDNDNEDEFLNETTRLLRKHQQGKPPKLSIPERGFLSRRNSTSSSQHMGHIIRPVSLNSSQQSLKSSLRLDSIYGPRTTSTNGSISSRLYRLPMTPRVGIRTSLFSAIEFQEQVSTIRRANSSQVLSYLQQNDVSPGWRRSSEYSAPNMQQYQRSADHIPYQQQQQQPNLITDHSIPQIITQNHQQQQSPSSGNGINTDGGSGSGRNDYFSYISANQHPNPILQPSRSSATIPEIRLAPPNQQDDHHESNINNNNNDSINQIKSDEEDDQHSISVALPVPDPSSPIHLYPSTSDFLNHDTNPNKVIVGPFSISVHYFLKLQEICHILFPTLQDWSSKTFFSKFSSLIALPLVFIFTVTLPVVESDDIKVDDYEVMIDDLQQQQQQQCTPINSNNQSFYQRQSVLSSDHLSSHFIATSNPQPPPMMMAMKPSSSTATTPTNNHYLSVPDKASVGGHHHSLPTSSTSSSLSNPMHYSSSNLLPLPSPTNDGINHPNTLPSSSSSTSSIGGGDNHDSSNMDDQDLYLDAPLEWIQWLTILQAIMACTFIFTVMAVNEYISYQYISVGFGIGCILALFIATYTDPKEQPKRYWFLSFAGFVIALNWIFLIANQMVGLLQALGAIYNISEAIMGLTIFALGSSVGDLVANTAIARMGFPTMAISACYAGPLLNMVLGVGISSTYQTLISGEPYKLDIAPTILVSSGGLITVLLSTLIVVNLNGYRINKELGCPIDETQSTTNITTITPSPTSSNYNNNNNNNSNNNNSTITATTTTVTDDSKLDSNIYQTESDMDSKKKVESKDPRIQHANYGKDMSKGRKKYRTKLKCVRFYYDEYSIGPKPLTTLLVSNLSPLTTETQIATYMSVYGQVELVEIEKNPSTGGSLGIAIVGYGGEDGHAAANLAIEKGHRRKMGQSNNVKIEFDPNGEKLKLAIAEILRHETTSNLDEPPRRPASSIHNNSIGIVDETPTRPHHSTLYREEGEVIDEELGKWSSGYDNGNNSNNNNYRYRHSRDYMDRRYYDDGRYRGYSNRSPPPYDYHHHPPPPPRHSSSSTSSSNKYYSRYPSYSSSSRQYDVDRYESSSRSSYGHLPPPPQQQQQQQPLPSSSSSSHLPLPPSLSSLPPNQSLHIKTSASSSSLSSSKWDQPPSSASSSVYESKYKSRSRSRSHTRSHSQSSRSRSRSRSIGRDPPPSNYYGNNEYTSSSRSRWDYDSNGGGSSRDNWDYHRRKRNDHWYTRDEYRRPREDYRPVSEKLPTILIPKKHLPFMRGVLEELRKSFYHYNYLDIYHDSNDWHIVFDSLSDAKRAMAMDRRYLFGYVLYLGLQDGSTKAADDVPQSISSYQEVQSLEIDTVPIKTTEPLSSLSTEIDTASDVSKFEKEETKKNISSSSPPPPSVSSSIIIESSSEMNNNKLLDQQNYTNNNKSVATLSENSQVLESNNNEDSTIHGKSHVMSTLENKNDNNNITTKPISPSPSSEISTTAKVLSHSSSSPSTTSPLLSSKEDDIIKHAKQILFSQLADVFLKDVKNRVIGPCIYDFLNPALHKRKTNVKNQSQDTEDNKEQISNVKESIGSTISNGHSILSSTQSDIKKNKENDYKHPTSSFLPDTTKKSDNSKSTSTGLYDNNNNNNTINKKDSSNNTDMLYSLPKSAQSILETSLPSFNKLPRFKKRNTSTATASSAKSATAPSEQRSFDNTIEKKSFYAKRRLTSKIHYEDSDEEENVEEEGEREEDYSSISIPKEKGNGDKEKQNGLYSDDFISTTTTTLKYNSIDTLKKNKVDSESLSPTTPSRTTSTTSTSISSEKLKLGDENVSNHDNTPPPPQEDTFFSSSEEGEYQSGASARSSDNENNDDFEKIAHKEPSLLSASSTAKPLSSSSISTIKSTTKHTLTTPLPSTIPAVTSTHSHSHKRSSNLERKKPRRLRDYLSDDDEEEEFDHRHAAFLRQLHQDDENNDSTDGGNSSSISFTKKKKLKKKRLFSKKDSFNDDDTSSTDDDNNNGLGNDYSDRFYKKKKQQQGKGKKLRLDTTDDDMTNTTIVNTNNDVFEEISGEEYMDRKKNHVLSSSKTISGKMKKRKRNSLLQQQQQQKQKYLKLEEGAEDEEFMDIDQTFHNKKKNDLSKIKKEQLYDNNGGDFLAIKNEKLDDNKVSEKPIMDREAYERKLLEPDSSDDDLTHYKKEENEDDTGKHLLELHPDWDPFQQAKDVEDFDFLRLAIMEKLGLWKSADADADASASTTTIINNKKDQFSPIPPLITTEKENGGCARSRGYYVIPDAEKATYLPKNKAVLDTSTLTTRLSSRTNRVNNRRFVVGMVMQKKAMADSDILKFNQLKGRKKQLRFAKSPIHDWGLYAEEHIDANDMVIEYVGEVIRQQVAEEREKKYERCGIGSSYLFRVDDDIVIDATQKGSIARFINHCCTPNCSAKIITVDKHKKIVIYANRDIEPGEEITYDYKFPIEADKIPCLCGSKFCKGTLN